MRGEGLPTYSVVGVPRFKQGYSRGTTLVSHQDAQTHSLMDAKSPASVMVGVPVVDWRAFARRFTASTPGGCTTDAAMIGRRAAGERREQLKQLELRMAAEARKRDPFTFRARRPFHPERLFVALSRGQMSRCKLEGIAWLASRNDEQAKVLHPPSTQLGSTSMGISIVRGPPWWAAIPRGEWPEGLAEDLLGTPLWDEVYGDRQVEIRVSFHATSTAQTMPQLHRKSVETELAACLLTMAELEAGPMAWGELDDPFLLKEERAPFSLMVGRAGPRLRPQVCRPCQPER